MSKKIFTHFTLAFILFLSTALSVQGQATLVSDKADYAPGTTATFTGSGFQPGEQVKLLVLHYDGTSDGGADHQPWMVTADASGAFVTTWHVCEDDCVGSLLRATADGQTTPFLHAEVFFYDATILVTGAGTVQWSALDRDAVTTGIQPPNSTDVVIVKDGTILNVDVSNALCASIQLGDNSVTPKGDGRLTFNALSQLTVSGNVTLGDASKSGTITMASGGALICNGLIFTAGSANNNMTQSSTSTITVNGTVTINQPGSNGNNNTWNINNGTATVSGIISLPGTNNNASRVSKIVMTTGTLNANGGMNFTATNADAAQRIIDMSGGAGSLNLKGTLTPAISTLTAGTTSTFNYYDNINAQTVNFFNSGAYNDLTLNNSGGVGAALSAAVTTANVAGNITVNTGTFDNGGFAIAGNSSKNFSVINGATFKISGTTGSGMVTGFGTKTFGATSTVDYAGITAAQTISSETYGHLTISGNNNKNLSTGTTTIAGTFKNTGGLMVAGTSTVIFTGASGSIDGAVSLKQFNNLQINSGANVTTTAGAGNIQVDGSFTNEGSFVQNSAQTITFNQTSGTKNLSTTGSPTTSFGSVIIQGAHTTTAGIDFTVTGSSFNVSNASGFFNGGTKTVAFGGATTLASGSGTMTFNDIIITGSLINNTNNKNFSVTGNWTNNGTYTKGIETITFSKGSGTQTLNNTTSSFYNIIHNGPGTLQLITSNLMVSNDVSNSAGTLDANGKNINVGGNWSNSGVFNAGTGTVSFNGSVSGKTIGGTLTGSSQFNNLVFNGPGSWSFSSPADVASDFTLTNGNVTPPSGNLNVAGNWTTNGNGFTNGVGTVTLNGGSQTLGGSFAPRFLNLQISGTADKTITQNVQVDNTLTLNNRNIITSGGTSIFANIVTRNTAGHIIGKLSKMDFCSTPTRTFEVGTATTYAPVNVNITGPVGNGCGNFLQIETFNNDYPDITTANLDASKSANRYWTIYNSGMTFTNAAITLNFDAADLDAGADPSTFVVGRNALGTWTYPTIANNNSSSIQFTATSLASSAVVFQAAQPAALPTINTNPTNQSVCVPNLASFTASTNSTPPSTVEWQVNTSSGFAAIPAADIDGDPYTVVTSSSAGVTTSTLTLNTSSALYNDYQYQAKFTNNKGNVTSSSATLTVNTAPSITGQPLNQSVTYGANATFTVDATGTGPLTYQWQANTGSGFTNISLTGIYSNTDANTATLEIAQPTVAMSGYKYRVIVSGTCSPVATSGEATLTVSKAFITIVNTSRSKVYGVTLSNADFAGSITGVVAGDNITVSRSCTGQGAIATVAGSPYPIIGTIVDPGTRIGNYTVSNPDGVLTITPATLTIVNTSRSKVYGVTHTNADYTGSITGLVAGDVITVTRASTGDAANATVAGSDYPIVGTLVDGANRAANYTVTNPNGLLTITPATLTIVNTSRSKVYGVTHTNADYAGTITGLVAGDVITVTRASTGDAAGSTVAGSPYPIVGTLVDLGGRAANYTVANPNGVLTITPATLTIVNTSRSKVYGVTHTNADYTGSITGLVAGDLITVTRASTGDAAGSTVAGSTYPIIGTIVDGGNRLANYTVFNPNGALTVTKATLTIVNNDRSKVYGVTLTNTDYTGSITGIVAGDNITVTRASTGGAANATVVAPGPTYPIAGTLVDPGSRLANYYVSNPDGTLTIMKASITVANNNRSKIYGVALTNADYSGSITGVVAGDNITVTRSSTGGATNATVVAPGPTYPIAGTMVDPGSRLGNYNVSNPNGTLTITPATTASFITVSPATQQYSDLITLTATITGGAPLVSGGPQAAASATFKIGTQIMGTANYVVSGLNLVATLSGVALLEPTPFGTAPTGQLAPGSRTVTAVVNSADPNFNVTPAIPSTAITITQENATIDYTGDQILATATATTSTAVVTLRANISDITATNSVGDPYPGDIRNAKVMFVNRDAGNAPISGWIQVSTLVNALDTKTGTVSFPWNVDLGSASDIETTVGIIVNNGYYIRDNTSDNIVVTVYKPNGDFITGGGYIVPTQSVGSMKSDVGAKTNFGFNVKFNKSGTNLQGNMNIIFRRTESDNKQHTYQIKANAMQSLGVNATNAKRQTANYVSKTNITDITNPSLPVALGGNKFLHVSMIDNGEPGSKDSISFVLVDGSADPTVLTNIIYSSNWISSKTQMMNLGGGNLVVHSGFNLGSSAPAARTAAPEITLIQPVTQPIEIPFSIKAYPNPSERFFTLKVASSAPEEVKIKVYDIVGRQVFIAKGTASQLYVFGEMFISGTYIVEVRQGNKRSTIKLVKN
ncbi:MAG: T9SS type A sorting domain-containing protein [Ferruginibacter sp.]